MEQYSKYYYLFQDGGRYHIETNPLICSANQWTGFYMITGPVLKKLKDLQPLSLSIAPAYNSASKLPVDLFPSSKKY